jgi:hypothetical protein
LTELLLRFPAVTTRVHRSPRSRNSRLAAVILGRSESPNLDQRVLKLLEYLECLVAVQRPARQSATIAIDRRRFSTSSGIGEIGHGLTIGERVFDAQGPTRKPSRVIGARANALQTHRASRCRTGRHGAALRPPKPAGQRHCASSPCTVRHWPVRPYKAEVAGSSPAAPTANRLVSDHLPGLVGVDVDREVRLRSVRDRDRLAASEQARLPPRGAEIAG